MFEKSGRFKVSGILRSEEYWWMRCVEVTVWRSWTRISTTTPLTTCLNENLTASCSSLTALQVRQRRATTDIQ